VLDRQRVSYLQQETVVAPVTSQHVMLKMRKRATRILATTTGVGNTVDALSASHGSDRHGADPRHGLDHYWSCRTTHTSPGVYCASTCLAGYASDGYQGCHNLASCLASCAHCDSSVRCRYDLTGAEIVAGAPDNAPTRFSGHILVWTASVVLQQAISLQGCRAVSTFIPAACDDMRTTTGETAGDSGHKSPSWSTNIWRLCKWVMIPVCAADMSSQVPRLLLEDQIMHPPGSQATFWSGQYLLCCGKLFPCRVAGQSPPLFLQRCEHGDMRTTIGETAGDSGRKSPS
jgi:hypothetical protein